MQTLSFAPSLTFVDLKQNLRAIQDNVVAPIMMRHGRAIFLTRFAVAGVLLAFATGGFDVWNLAYGYNCVGDQSFYPGFCMLAAATIRP